MALVVEDGTGKANADALISVVDATAYHAGRGNAEWASETYDDDDRERAIRRATAFLSNSFTWAGIRSKNRKQALAWPRSGVVDQEGNGIKADEIPIEIADACAEIALRELVSPGAMNPDFTASDLVKREKIGAIETEYALSNTSADAQRPVLLVVRDMVSQFLKAGAGNSIIGSSVRV